MHPAAGRRFPPRLIHLRASLDDEPPATPPTNGADSTAAREGYTIILDHFFGFWSGQPYAIGTHSGGEKTTSLWWTIEDDNAGAGGNAMVDLVRWARSNWP
jgi:hypothetical protein